jgi:RNA polymerase sigma factor (sigma-70 family)
VIGVLVRRGADFAAAEDAVQDALVEAVRVWPDDPPRDPKGWLVTVAWRKFLDAARADTSRRHREERVEDEPAPGPGEAVDDTLQLYFLCAHPSLTPASAVALTLRAVGGLTTRQIAQAYLVPEATMAQRISRAKRTVSGVRFNQPGDVATVLRVLYLVFNEGYSGDVDLAAEAIRLTRQLAAKTTHEEVAGLLALMLLHHARRPARTGPDGRLVPLAEQDRSRWDTRLIAEGVDVLQAALARDRLGEFQAQAAIAALHADARTAEETDWVQIVEWYDELVRLTDSPVARLNRAVAVGEADGPRAGLAALAELDPALPRHTAVAAYLHERDGDPVTAAGSTPKPPDRRPTSPNATTSRDRPHGSTRSCAPAGRTAPAAGRATARRTTGTRSRPARPVPPVTTVTPVQKWPSTRRNPASRPATCGHAGLSARAGREVGGPTG